MFSSNNSESIFVNEKLRKLGIFSWCYRQIWFSQFKWALQKNILSVDIIYRGYIYSNFYPDAHSIIFSMAT